VRCACSPTAGGIRYSLEDDDTDPRSPNSVAVTGANHQQPNESVSLSSSAPEAEAAEQVVHETERVMVNIRDLLRSVVRIMTRHRRQKDEDQRLMNDWMLAAAVIDRFFCFIIVLVFIGATVGFALSVVSHVHTS